MKVATIGAWCSAAMIAGSTLLVASTDANAELQPERICRGQGPDDDCQVGPPTGTADGHGAADEGLADLAAANLATAMYQDVAQAEAAGYLSTLDTLGCFEDRRRGGMGLHFANDSLIDASLDVTKPEALVYELDSAGNITTLVAHEYIVPTEQWNEPSPPRLFGRDFHQHPSMPLWILHTWIWKDNPLGVFEDFNPRVRPCPDGVPVYGENAPVSAAISDCLPSHRSPSAGDVASCA